MVRWLGISVFVPVRVDRITRYVQAWVWDRVDLVAVQSVDWDWGGLWKCGGVGGGGLNSFTRPHCSTSAVIAAQVRVTFALGAVHTRMVVRGRHLHVAALSAKSVDAPGGGEEWRILVLRSVPSAEPGT